MQILKRHWNLNITFSCLLGIQVKLEPNLTLPSRSHIGIYGQVITAQHNYKKHIFPKIIRHVQVIDNVYHFAQIVRDTKKLNQTQIQNAI